MDQTSLGSFTTHHFGLSELIFFGGSDYYRNLHKHALDQIPLGHPWDTQVFVIGYHPWSRGPSMAVILGMGGPLLTTLLGP